NDVLIGSGAGVSAREIVSSGGVASGTTVSNTGLLVIQAGGSAVDAHVVSTNIGSPGSNGALVVSSGGTATGTVVSSGGILNVFSGGVESGAVVSGGGNVNVGQSATLGGTTFGDLLSGNGSASRAIETVFA